MKARRAVYAARQLLRMAGDPRIEHDVDAVALQEIRRAHTGELQQLRRIIRAARDQDLLARPRGADAPVLLVFDRLGTTPVEQDALRQRRGFDMQIAAVL